MKQQITTNFAWSITMKMVLFPVIAFTVLHARAQYCISAFTDASYENIANVTYAGINNFSGGIVPNNDYTNLVATLPYGSTDTLSVTILPAYWEYAYAFIDWNKNNKLNDVGEVYTVASYTSSPGPHKLAISVPANALPGYTRMRIIEDWNNSNPNPCRVATWGEVEDYTVFIKPNRHNNAGVIAIVSPGNGCEGTQNVLVKIANFGVNRINSVTMNWTLNGIPQPTAVYSNLLDTLYGAGSMEAVVNLGQVTLSAGVADTITVWISQVNSAVDSMSINDTLTSIVVQSPIVSNFPYFEDFENGQADWTAGGKNSTWAFGTPAKSNITGAASGVNAFVNGGLAGNYNSDEISYVSSPCFDFTNFKGTPWLALDINYNSEPNNDGTVLMLSADGGATWQRVGFYSDPDNWYNSVGILSNPGGQDQGWTGTGPYSSQGWKRAKHALPVSFNGKKVKFRLNFSSNGSVVEEGFAFDNFTIVDFKAADLGPDQISLCGKPAVTLDPHVNFNGTIKWVESGNLLDTLSQTYAVSSQGTYWVVYKDTMINETTSDTVEVVQSVPPNIQFDRLNDTIPLSGQVTLNPHLDHNLTYTWTPGNFSYPYLLVIGSEYGVGKYEFNLKVVDSVLCEANGTVTVVIEDITGIAENLKDGIQIFPNPVKEMLNVVVKRPANGSMDIRLYDPKGSLIYSNVVSLSNASRIEINMSNLNPGLYLIQIGSGKDSFTERVVKQ